MMLTNPRDAFSGQSRSPNTVAFHVLDIVSSCAVVTLSSRGAVFIYSTSNNVVTLKSGSDVTQGGTIRKIVYGFLLVFFSNIVFEIFDFKTAVTLNTGLGVRQGHWKCHHAIERVRLPIDVL